MLDKDGKILLVSIGRPPHQLDGQIVLESVPTDELSVSHELAMLCRRGGLVLRHCLRAFPQPNDAAVRDLLRGAGEPEDLWIAFLCYTMRPELATHVTEGRGQKITRAWFDGFADVSARAVAWLINRWLLYGNVLPGESKQGEGGNEETTAAWLAALKTVRDELDSWGDFEQSEPTREYFPEPITDDKTPGTEPHPLWLAVVALQRFYPKNRLPKLAGALDAWADLCKYSRQHGDDDRLTQRDEAVEAARILRQWVTDEEARADAQASDRIGTPERALTRGEMAGDRASQGKTTPIVFISSTVEDLKEYRAKARDAVNQLGFVPRMKEYFAASGNPPLAECLQKVSGSPTEPPADVVVLIVAHRYGWVPRNQSSAERKSITWLECEKAQQSGKKVLAFVMDTDYPWPEERREEHRIAKEAAKGTGTSELLAEVQSNVDWLGRFKTWIDEHCTRVTFTTPDSLCGAVFAALDGWQKRR